MGNVALPAGSHQILFPSLEFVIGFPISSSHSFINICTSQDVCSVGDDFTHDVSVFGDSLFRFELSQSCGQLKFRSNDGDCSIGSHTECDFSISSGLSHVEFSLMFFADAVSSGCVFRILSLDSFLRASSFPVISMYNESDNLNAFELVTHPTSLFVTLHPPSTIDTGQVFQTQGSFCPFVILTRSVFQTFVLLCTSTSANMFITRTRTLAMHIHTVDHTLHRRAK